MSDPCELMILVNGFSFLRTSKKIHRLRSILEDFKDGRGVSMTLLIRNAATPKDPANLTIKPDKTNTVQLGRVNWNYLTTVVSL